MIRHFLIIAWRNIEANRLQSAIAVFGLAIGVVTAILVALVVRGELTYDGFIPGHERTYLGVSVLSFGGGQPDNDNTYSHWRAAQLLKLNIPEIENAARLLDDNNAHLKRGQVAAKETIYWADPDIFDVLPLPVLRGDLRTALRHPDSIVMTESAARKYFGTDDAIGQTVQVEGHVMTLTAVIRDIPANSTELEHGIFASGLAPYSAMVKLGDSPPGSFLISVRTYVRLKPGAAIAKVRPRAAALITQLLPKNDKPGSLSFPYSMPLVALRQIHLLEGLNPGVHARLAVIGLIGFLILFIAVANFVNLSVARAARREKEVGLRKAVGAGRRQLILQFLGEAMVAVLLAAGIAIAFSEWLLPRVNVFLQSGASFAYWSDPLLGLCLLGGVLLLGIAAGAYPAFILSAFRPANALKGLMSHSPGMVRNGLVVLQFAILTGLIIAAGVVFQQRNYAMNERLRVNTDQILLVKTECPVRISPTALNSTSPCWAHTCTRPAFRAELLKLPGVRDVICTNGTLMNGEMMTMLTMRGQSIQVSPLSTEFGIFGLYGIRPVAGTLPPDAQDDALRSDAPVVINVAAARRMGFASPAAAVGQTIPVSDFKSGGDGKAQARIAAVVPDFSLHSVSDLVHPTIYRQGPESMGLFHVRLAGRQIPETLAAIDRAWTATGGQDATPRSFLSDEMQKLYAAMLREGEMFSLFAGVAVFLACLGLFGLSIANAERRTKEIGIRKAMGATNWDILGLMLWQFSRPVLWANVIAWPLAWWGMQHWLDGFAYRVTLQWWLFPAASIATLLIALFTVSGQAILVARQKPVLALRYE